MHFPFHRTFSGILLVTLIAASRVALAAPEKLAPSIVLLIGEDEYKTWETLPEFAKTELEPRGFRVTVILEDPKEKHHFPGIVEALAKADLLVLSTRRRLPPKDQLDAARTYLDAGKPLVGIRTACHAFAPPLGNKSKPDPAAGESWPEFDPQVLGGHYTNHHGAGPNVTVTVAPGAEGAAILKDVDVGQLVGKGSLYKVSPLDPSCVPLLVGTIPEKPAEPVAWTHVYGANKARVFYTSLGHPDDFKEPAFRQLLLNGIIWALDRAAAPASKDREGATGGLPGRVLSADKTMAGKPSAAPAAVLKPSGTVPSLNVADDLRVDLVLQDPVVAKPLYINFDERGRMWVVQYRQYPWPAGLKMLSRDGVYRNVYDPPAPPPPPFTGENAKFRGQDRITIHESTKGDGVFDKTTVFLDGLNLATAALKGRGGVFVLEPPYLLFYKCSDNADRPDSEKPEVLLSGFGIEDTHSIANSLRWGPDGWIYGAQGSTVSAAIVRNGADGKPLAGEKPVRIMGQMIWRYHPETRRFEIFAEGGGNAFGVEIDSKGRIYSGHNGGNTRGFHYIQGGYFQKGFDKHGALSNPYTFGYIRQMDHEKVERFTHAFTIYEGDAFPAEYFGKLFAIAPHMHYVVASEITPVGSTFRTRDVGKVITPGKQPRDDWFTPVDIQLGPDGALYIADWYAAQANHYRSSEGKTNPDLGHVYRLFTKDTKVALEFDLGSLSSDDLAKGYLDNPNRWWRQQVLRLLGDRKDHSLIPVLTRMVRENTGQFALEAFWALNLSGGFNDAMATETLDHREAHVRRWAVRLIGDGNVTSTEIAAKLAAMAKTEPDVEVRSQLACTARRLPTEQALPIIAALLTHDEDAGDPHIPRMLWWALEAHAVDREAVLQAMEQRVFWTSSLHPEERTLPENLMQRWAMAGSQEDLTACARLLNLSGDAKQTGRLIAAFERAFEGRPIPPLPDVLAEALGKTGGRFATLLGVRQRDDRAVDAALAIGADSKAKPADRLQFIRALGDVQAKPDKTVPMLLDLARSAGDDSLRIGALGALQKFDAPAAGAEMVDAFNALPKSVQPAALSFLASRGEWALALMRAVDSGAIKARLVPEDVIDRLRSQEMPQVARLVALHFPDTRGSKAEMEQKIAKFKSIVSAGGGRPLAGKELFYGKVACASCHTVFDKGGHIGPDLTSYDRRNLDSMLLAIVNPSAEIREGFENYIITTKDGRTLDGFKVDEDGKVFVLRGTDGQNNVIPVEQIKTRRVSPKSLMPEGLLDGLTEEELRDLFAFLASTTPPK